MGSRESGASDLRSQTADTATEFRAGSPSNGNCLGNCVAVMSGHIPEGLIHHPAFFVVVLLHRFVSGRV